MSDGTSFPEFINEASELVGILKEYSPRRLQNLMSINNKLATINVERFLNWSVPFSVNNSSPAILTFTGDVYLGLKANTLNSKTLIYSQDHLRILSGLYGLLRPLDLMQPYRLEMGANLKTPRGKDLYAFWGQKITDALNNDIKTHKEKVIVNLASNEYFKAIDTKLVQARIINCHFREDKNGEIKFITVYGKKARGLMARFIIENRIGKAEDLKAFDSEGYYYEKSLSKEDEWVFVR